MKLSLGLFSALALCAATPAFADWTSEGDTLETSSYSQFVFWTDLLPDGLGGIQANVHHRLTNNSFERPVSWYRFTPQGENIVSGSMAPVERVCPDGSGGSFGAYTLSFSPFDQGGIWLYHQTSSGSWDASYGSLNGLHVLAPDAAHPAHVTDFEVVSDGSGGVYLVGSFADPDRVVVWRYLNGAPATGWTADGIPVQESDASGSLDMAAISDGAGGLLIGRWSAGPGSSMFVCRVLPDGTTAWTRKVTPPIAVAGGPIEGLLRSGDRLFMCWRDDMISPAQIRLQSLVTATGFFISGWPSGGVSIAAAPYDSSRVRLASDEVDGVYVAWSNGFTLRAIRFTGAGMPAAGWPAAGVPLTDPAAEPVWSFDPRMQNLAYGAGIAGLAFEVAGSANGLVTCWEDTRRGIQSIRARWVLPNGTLDPAQPDTGRYVCPSPAYLDGMMSDGQNGAYVAWSRWIPPNSDTRWMVSWLPYANPWVGVPDSGPASLPAMRAWPNPARDALQLEFAPLGDETAHIELVDVTGHRLRALSVSEPGARSARFERLNALPSGVYFARIVSGARTQSVRVALLH
jgi:hypothetical protein